MGDQRTVLNRGGLLMKKAYVKPVFLAEEFVAASSYVASSCGQSVFSALLIEYDKNFCAKRGCNADSMTFHRETDYNNESNKPAVYQEYNGTKVEGVDSYWDYANYNDDKAYLFTGGSSECDFLWNGHASDKVYVWDNVLKGAAEGAKQILATFGGLSFSLTGFLTGNEATNGHPTGYEGQSFRS